MRQKPERNIKKKIVNIFGALGYLFSFLQWFWTIMLYFSFIQSLVLFISSVTNSKHPEHYHSLMFALPGPIEAVVLGIVTVLMILITIYVLVKLPVTIAKTSKKIIHKTSESVTPILISSQHIKDTKSNRTFITAKVILVFKVLFILTPVLLTTISRSVEKLPIDYSIAAVIGFGLACFSVAFFIIQYSLARLLRVKLSNIW